MRRLSKFLVRPQTGLSLERIEPIAKHQKLLKNLGVLRLVLHILKECHLCMEEARRAHPQATKAPAMRHAAAQVHAHAASKTASMALARCPLLQLSTHPTIMILVMILVMS
jgi:hypothetical protein